jgi:hypothetical protein
MWYYCSEQGERLVHCRAILTSVPQTFLGGEMKWKKEGSMREEGREKRGIRREKREK